MARITTSLKWLRRKGGNRTDCKVWVRGVKGERKARTRVGCIERRKMELDNYVMLSISQECVCEETMIPVRGRRRRGGRRRRRRRDDDDDDDDDATTTTTTTTTTTAAAAAAATTTTTTSTMTTSTTTTTTTTTTTAAAAAAAAAAATTTATTATTAKLKINSMNASVLQVKQNTLYY